MKNHFFNWMSQQNSKDLSRKKYRILSREEKQMAMSQLQNNYTSEQLELVAKQFQTSVKNLRRWYNEGVDRKPGCGRKKLNEEAEKLLAQWIVEHSISQGRRVRRTQLKEKAIQLFNDKLFKASKAWQDEFIRAHDIKFLVNRELNNRGMLNNLQQQKFEEQLKQRTAKETQDPKIEAHQAPTEVKQEEQVRKAQTSQFYLNEKQEEEDEPEKLEQRRLDDIEEWFMTPEHLDLKYEDSNYNKKSDSPKIELFHEDSEVYFPKQKRILQYIN